MDSSDPTSDPTSKPKLPFGPKNIRSHAHRMNAHST